MPTTRIAQNAEERRKEIEVLLHNGHEITLKDLGWLMYGFNADLKEMAECDKLRAAKLDELVARIEQVVNRPPSRLATVAQESLVKWAIPFGMGLFLWLLIQFSNSGFKVP